MIHRLITEEFNYLLQHFPAVGIVGARQVGKTTLAKSHFGDRQKFVYLDLERNSDRAKLTDAELFLQSNENKTVILDEIQFMPELFPLLRSLIDDNRRAARFIILGSASPALLRQSSESLAGRIAYLHLRPLNLLEVKTTKTWQETWLLGGFPEPLLKSQNRFASTWQQNFINNYIQRDLPALGLAANPNTSLRLLQMLSSNQGSTLNFSVLARSLGVSMPSVKTYFSYYENAFLVYSLKPWSSNLKKRIVKSPKVFFTDTGMLHHLLGIKNFNSLMGHLAVGHSWEAFVINQLISVLKPDDEYYFYRTQDGAEIDFLVRRNNSWLLAAEIKLSNSPTLTKGTHIAMEDLELKHLFVITPEADNYYIKENIEVIGLLDILERVEQW
ncbi:ATP-binding protein [Owenweeksia hongkongensis]|uniref:ATP-binding protein n=1 Tax=Owenweeksia hongkongensis TaxID=253245 RepID=UPI003A8EBDDA